MKTTIRGMEFPSQKELSAYIKKLKARQKPWTKIQGEDHLFLKALVNRHPNQEYHNHEDIVFGIDRTPICDHLMAKYSHKGWLRGHRISTRKCVTGKEDTPRTLLIQAARNAVQYQLDQFKETAGKDTPCVLCWEVTPYPHADHHPLKFQWIFQMFEETRDDIPSDFDDVDNGRKVKFKPKDKPFVDAWAAYHQKIATYRILCAACNVKER